MEDKGKQIEELIEKGRGLLYKQSYKAALEIFLKGLEIDPDNAEIHYCLGSVSYYQGKLKEAHEFYLKAVELNTEDPHYHFVLGNSYMDQGDYMKAVSEFSKSIDIDDTDAHVYKNLGEACYLTGDFGKSAEAFKTVLDMDSSLSEVYISLYISLRKDNRNDEAESVIEKAKKNINKSDTQYQVAKLYLGILDDEDLKNKLGEQRNECMIFYHSGMGMLFNDKPDKARGYFQKCLEKNLTYIPEYRRAQCELERTKAE